MNSTPTFNIGAAQEYLLHQYDVSIQLFREAPNAAPTRYWYFNDNYLAQLALGKASPPLALFPTYRPSRVKVLGGEAFTDGTVLAPPSQIEVGTLNDKVSMTETPNFIASPFPPNKYADVAFYNVINMFNLGFYSDAVKVLRDVERALPVTGTVYWDGHGWVDATLANRTYSTYKSALYLIALKTLAIEGLYTSLNRDILAYCQVFNRSGFDNQNGGVITGYTATSYLAGDTNTETTSLAILALL